MMNREIRIIRVESNKDWKDFSALLLVYGKWRGHDKALGDFEEEIIRPQKKYVGAILAYQGDVAVGCVAFQRLEERICEMKRLFVREPYQSRGIGGSLISQVIKLATELGYHEMKLDSHPHMLAAQALYARYGFEQTQRYNQNPTRGIKFYKKNLKK